MKLSVSHSTISGDVRIPGSKSHTIRALAVAMLAKGNSVIQAPLVSSDTISCLKAASALGAWIKRGDDSVWHISGTNGNLIEPARIMDFGNSGTGIKLFSALAALSSHKTSFDGDGSLRSRPLNPLLNALTELGVKCESANGCAPFSVQGPLAGGEATVAGKSSQYLSALLFAAPLCHGKTILHVTDLNEIPYVEMTLKWLERQNINLSYSKNYSLFEIPGEQKYTPFTVQIPGDFSTAAFPAVAAAVTGGSVTMTNLDFTDPQGDKRIFEYLQLMGAHVQRNKTSITIQPGGKLHAVELDLNATPDALPILAVAAACAQGISVFKNVAQARIKETDRIHCMKLELEKMGIMVEEFEDGLAVTGGELHPAQVDSHLDHRIAMSLAIAGFACKKSDDDTIIDGAESIAVTYPDFFKDFARMGGYFYEK